MSPCENVKPCLMPSATHTKYAAPASRAWMTYRTGATKRNANSIGSVMPVRNAVSAAEIMMPPTFARCSGRAARHIASAAAGRPHILNR